MRPILKGTEPQTLTLYRRFTPDGDYRGYHDNGELHESLVKEQRGLCCYCMSRITTDTVRIEHWHCQSDDSHDDLDYINMLGVCNGGEGRLPSGMFHCDKSKGNRPIKFNPANPADHIEQRIYYSMDGTIASQDEEFNADLNSKNKLNLNQFYLKNNRKGVIDGFQEWTKKMKDKHGPVSRELFEQKCKWRVDGTGTLEPYCQVAVWMLQRRLARM